MRTRHLALAGTAAALVATVLSIAPAPAGAASGVDGYVWANQPTAASYVAATGYEHNSTGGTVQITRSATGRYRVRFTGMGASGGVAHVRPYGATNAGLCTVVNWKHTADLDLNVRCFDTAGAPADMMFVANFTNRAHRGGHFAYFWADRSTTPGPYAPVAAYSYDSTGLAPQVERLATGEYAVYLNALSDPYPDTHDNGHLQITAYNTGAVHCAMRVAADEDPTPLAVSCFDADGEPTDSQFTVTYANGMSPLATTPVRGNAYIRNHFADPPYVAGWHGSVTAPTVSHLGVGRYAVRFPGLASAYGHAIASSQEVNGDYCNVAHWHDDVTTFEEVVHVRCYNGSTHALTDQDFGVAFLS